MSRCTRRYSREEHIGFSVQSLGVLSWAWTQLYFRHLNVSSKRKEERLFSLPTTRVQLLCTASRKKCLKDFKRMILFTSPKLVSNSLNTQGPVGSVICLPPCFLSSNYAFFGETASNGAEVSLGSQLLLMLIPILFSPSAAEISSGRRCKF